LRGLVSIKLFLVGIGMTTPVIPSPGVVGGVNGRV